MQNAKCKEDTSGTSSLCPSALKELLRTLRKGRRCTSRQLLVAASVAIICNKGRPYRLIIVFIDRNNSHCVTLLRYVSVVQDLPLCGLWAKETILIRDSDKKSEEGDPDTKYQQ